MCEFMILLKGEEVFQDVVRVKVEQDRVFLTDILGETLEIPLRLPGGIRRRCDATDHPARERQLRLHR